MENDVRGMLSMLGIGELARESGLTVSALRFYDRAGVLVPAVVDPVTGYRRYRDGQLRAARLVAALRRVGMPVAEITAAVRALPDPAAVRPLLDMHLRRLEDGLADARREISRAHALLNQEVHVTRVTLPAAALAAAVNAVRFAAHPAVPAEDSAGNEGGADAADSGNDAIAALAGILFEAGEGALTLVATDRFRLATTTIPATVEGPPVRVIVPADAIDLASDGDDRVTSSDDDRETLTSSGDGRVAVTSSVGDRVAMTSSVGDRVDRTSSGDDQVTLTLSADEVSIGGATHRPIPGDYPDFRRLVRTATGPRVQVDVAALRSAVESAPDVWREHDGRKYPTTILTVDSAGELRLAAEDEWAGDAEAHVAVHRDFLLQALDAGGAGQLVLELDGPIHPLAIRTAQRDRFSLLMPVRH
ncbi:MerR family transcriptional regulator [Actinoplanes sp. NPDC051633]|uniref:DNA polymerase III subunit beta family protein n=1 Tax=Actinoplanes sp. NPDC051633 TaxID=3155670 RepID=UPI0034218E23